MIKILISILFGIVEGITEWLPISSTGHMILLNKFISLETVTSAKFYSMYEVVIQLGAILAVVVTRYGHFKSLMKHKKALKSMLKCRLLIYGSKLF